MTDLLAYDSTQPSLIPADAKVILYYCDGKYRWTGEDLARFPDARRRAITVEGNPAANIADVESGDMRPDDVPAFLRAWRHEHPHGEPGTVYCSRTTLIAVRTILARAGFNYLEWNCWLSTLDGSKPREAEYGGKPLVAVQYAGGPDAEYDTSVVWDRSWPRSAK